MSLREDVERLKRHLSTAELYSSLLVSEFRIEFQKALEGLRSGIERTREIDREYMQQKFKLCPRCGVWFFGCTNVYPHVTLSKPDDRPDYCPRCCREIEAKPPHQ